MGWYYGFRPYVSVGQRRANAARELTKLAKKGRTISPVKIAGTKIVTTFWGNAWCDNLESYSDYSNRLPRGRTYVRNGSVVDLQIEAGRITAIVSGSELYDVRINIKPLAGKTWSCLKGECGGKIGSLVELLQGRLSQGVMELVTKRDGGLFPKPSEIDMDCSCPDSAGMCKHIAAVMYGIGARFDERPETLFALRKVDHMELIAEAGAPSIAASTSQQTIAAGDLADVFGIEIDTTGATAPATAAPAAPARPVKIAKRAHRAVVAREKAVSRKVVDRVRAVKGSDVSNQDKKHSDTVPASSAGANGNAKKVVEPSHRNPIPKARSTKRR